MLTTRCFSARKLSEGAGSVLTKPCIVALLSLVRTLPQEKVFTEGKTAGPLLLIAAQFTSLSTPNSY